MGGDVGWAGDGLHGRLVFFLCWLGYASTLNKGTSAGIRRERVPIWGDSNLTPFLISNLVKVQQTGNPPVSLVPPVSLLVGFPDFASEGRGAEGWAGGWVGGGALMLTPEIAEPWLIFIGGSPLFTGIQTLLAGKEGCDRDKKSI